MLFNSYQFFIFFPTVTVLFFCFPRAWRWLLLLLASCTFYMAFIPKYILILLATIIVDYSAGIMIERTTSGKSKKLLLTASLLVTVAILAFFKYFNFLNANVAAAAHWLHWNYGVENLKIILPIGLSFHTFQSMSYVIEVYRGKQKAERHFGIYALYVMFYPQLVAGPIERPQNLLHQFREHQAFDYDRITGGLKRMAFGLFKKAAIADVLAPVVDRVYNHPHEYSGLPLIGATVCFAYQIYCDFSGYSDIAIGSAQVMGFKLMENFDRPYASRSIAEFWRRWHMSLMTWFRDYIYIPLGGNRVKRLRVYANLFVTFLISGLWHGANWTFVLWGALNGVYLILSSLTARIRQFLVAATSQWFGEGIQNAFRIGITFCLVCIGWVFFRADSLSTTVYILSHVFEKSRGVFAVNGFVVLFIILMEYIQITHGQDGIRNLFKGKPFLVRWSFYYALVMINGIVLLSNNKHSFIYFQF